MAGFWVEFFIKNFSQEHSVFWYHLIICCVVGIPSLAVMTVILELTGVQGFYGLIHDRMKKIFKNHNPIDT